MGVRADGSKKNRKDPLPSVARKLWAFSGNVCAWGDPNCTTRLVTDEGAWVGKVAHIIGAEPGSARHEAWDGNDVEDLRSFDNLMLLCGEHHDEIDSKETRDQYPVAYLRAVKQRHEATYRYAVENIESEFNDTLQRTRVRPAVTMRRFFDWEDAGLEPDEERSLVDLINRFAERIKRLTRMARQLLVLVVTEKSPDFELVLRRFSTDRETLRSVCRELESAEMVYLHADEWDEERGQLSLMSGALEGLDEMWEGLRTFCSDEEIDLADILVDLRSCCSIDLGGREFEIVDSVG
ncbi:HNH endonuclease [Streptomyces sp. NPDC001480]|uniref:HNH endonuclease n=1 Tax=Streptomyces sp. NPDC001480 TaxID=3364577 RepID=UPI0036997062